MSCSRDASHDSDHFGRLRATRTTVAGAAAGVAASAEPGAGARDNVDGPAAGLAAGAQFSCWLLRAQLGVT